MTREEKIRYLVSLDEAAYADDWNDAVDRALALDSGREKPICAWDDGDLDAAILLLPDDPDDDQDCAVCDGEHSTRHHLADLPWEG